MVVGIRWIEAKARARLAPRIDVEKLGGDVARLLGGLALGFRPLIRTELVKGRCLLVATGVTRDQVKRRDGDVQACLFRIVDGEEFALLTVNRENLQPPIATHSVLDVNHLAPKLLFQIVHHQQPNTQ